jgi:signal transduction histidine kinase
LIDYKNYLDGKWETNSAMQIAFYLRIACIALGGSFILWKKYISQHFSFKLRHICSISFTGLNLLLASMLTINDQFINKQLTVFISAIFMVGVMMTLTLKEIALLFGGSGFITITGISLSTTDNPYKEGLMGNLFVISFLCGVIAYYIYVLRLEDFEKSSLIEEQKNALLDAKNLLEKKVKDRTEDLEKVNSYLVSEVEMRKKVELALKKSRYEMERFVYRSSHDMRSPISSVLGLIDLIKMENPSLTTLSYLGMAKKSLDKLDFLIQDIEAFVKNSEQNVEFRKILVPTLMRSVMYEVKTLRPNHDVQIKMQDIPEDSVIFSDTERLIIILKNLIVNSIDYADKEKEQRFCRISMAQKDNKVLIQVTDNGIGIPEDNKDKVWEMFFRGKTSPNSGLGLYIVKQMVELIQSDISMESEEGVGTTVTLSFPRQDTQAQPAAKMLSVA